MAPFQRVKGDEDSSVSVDEEVDLIDVVNTLQNKLAATGHSLDIDLPQIVVIGCQSAGKSSVLERFVGKEFLPRGTGTVTRRPIIVQMIPCPEEYGEFLHGQEEQFDSGEEHFSSGEEQFSSQEEKFSKEKRFRGFNAIRKEIKRLTDEECGPAGFSEKPISLRIYSPRVLKLTVVDLPGILGVAVDGQPPESVEVVKKIVHEYIKNPRTIILVVVPMTLDGQSNIVNSNALGYAKSVDPEGERTIGVLTMLDTAEADARDILDNKVVYLKRGWVGVVNRSSKEIEEGKDMDYIEKKERDFFQNSGLYSHMAHRMGIPYLQKLLQKSLRQHIKQSLPQVRNDIAVKLSRFEKEIKEFDSVIGDGPNARQLYMVRLIQKFSDDIKVKIMGYSEMVPTDTLTHGALINCKLHTEIQEIISQALLPNEEEISRLIPNLNGMRNSISIPSLAVDSVCRALIDRFKAPLDVSVLCVKETLLEAVADSAKLLNTCPSLKHEVMYLVNQWIDKECENTKDRLKSHIDAEMFYINTGHPGFDSSSCDPVAPTAGPVKVWKDFDSKNIAQCDVDTFSANFQKLLSSNGQMQGQVQYVIAIVIKYLEIIKVQVSDIAVKYIAFFLVKKVLNAIAQDLVPSVLDAANFSSVTEDCDDEIRRREKLISSCNGLKDALKAIRSF